MTYLKSAVVLGSGTVSAVKEDGGKFVVLLRSKDSAAEKKTYDPAKKTVTGGGVVSFAGECFFAHDGGLIELTSAGIIRAV